MQKITLELNSINFYCPATGQQVMSIDDFNPSPALLFSYLEGNMTLDNTTDEIENLFNTCLNEADSLDKYSNFDHAFKKLIDEKFAHEKNYILFSIYSDRDVFHMAFDMNYAAVEEEDTSIEGNLPEIETLYDNFIESQSKKPLKSGYAVFTSDEMGIGAFNFCDNREELAELIPSLIFIEALTEGYSIYENELLNELFCLNLNFDPTYERMDGNSMDLIEFQEELNTLLNHYQINFIGPVTDLFDTNNAFAKELIEEFGKDPVKNEKEYLEFLKAYLWG